MRIARFSTDENPRPRVGFELRVADIRVVVVAQRAYADALAQTGDARQAERLAGALLPDSVTGILEGGSDSLRALHLAHHHAVSRLRGVDDVVAWTRSGRAVAEAAARRLPPVEPGKIMAVGSNYPTPGEQPPPRPDRPVVFAKFADNLCPDGGQIIVDGSVDDLDFEGELAVVIGSPARDVSVENALSHVAGYTVVNDLSRRGVRAEERKQGFVMFGKNFAYAAPCGPVMVTADEVPDPQDLLIETWVNGVADARDSTSQMRWSVAELVAHCSAVGLASGDLILTGAPKRPAGGAFHALTDGDEVSISISGVGQLSNGIAVRHLSAQGN